MATPTGFKEANTVLTAPDGSKDVVGNLPIVRVPPLFTGSVWELSKEELSVIFQTGKIFVGVMGGGKTQPAIFVTAYTPGVPLQCAQSLIQQIQDSRKDGNGSEGNGETDRSEPVDG